jgi:muconolactone delta-isomerase
MSSSLFDMTITCMIMSSPSHPVAPLKIGGSLMYLHATGTITDLGKVEPYLPEETRVLAELHAEGVVKNLFRPSGQPKVYLIVEADDVEDARRQVGRLPLVSHGLLHFEFEPVEKLL